MTLDFRGVEFEATYQPNKNFHATMSLSYIDAHTDDSTLAADTGSVNDTFDDSRPDIIAGTGVGSPSYTVFGPGDLRYPGLPKILFQHHGQLHVQLRVGCDLQRHGLQRPEQRHPGVR